MVVVWLGAAALILSGGAIGLALGWGGAVAVSALIQSRTGLSLAFRPEWTDAWLVLGLVTLGTILAAIPALLSYRQPVDAALRG